jgi:phage-related tail protein
MTRDALVELKRMAQGQHRVLIELQPAEALMLVDLIQVGCANAACDGPVKDFGRRYVERVTEFFGHSSSVAAVIAAGWIHAN